MNTKLCELDINYKLFLDKSIVLYGESGSGKSVLVKDIMFTLSNHIDQVLVVSPTDRQNNTYGSGIVPGPCIHYEISAELLDNIWNRQKALATVYSRSNKPEFLKSLFYRIPNLGNIHAFIKAIYEKLATGIREMPDTIDRDGKIAEMKEECEKLVISIYKKYILENNTLLGNMRLSPEEMYALKFHNINPRLLLIFDDCTEMFSTYGKHPVVKMLFTQGRWAYITVIIACHSDKTFLPEQKKNTFVTIFTQTQAAAAYIERPTTSLDPEDKKMAHAARRQAFDPMHKNQKLVFVRGLGQYFKYTASLRGNFRFGSKYIWDYCKEIETTCGHDTNNKFMGSFQ
jgi:energy-coupling factor transporter ATP-binding protein EcfA2